MNLIIDTERVQDLGLTLDEYMILLKAYYQEVGISLNYSGSQMTLQQLSDNSYIRVNSNGPVLRERGWAVFENSPNDRFEEFLDLYPKEVMSGGSKRITAPINKDSQWANELRRGWAILTNHTTDLQEEIISKLKYSINMLERSNNLQYLPKIDNWLGKRTWENITIEKQITFDKSI